MERLRPNRARGRSLVYALLALFLLLGSIPAHRSTWQGNAELHTIFETIATVLAFVTGAMALVRYYTKKSGMFLLLGSGFLGGAFLDAYHAMVTSSFFAGHTPAVLSNLTPWSGLMSRVFLSLLMCASVVAWKRETLRPGGDQGEPGLLAGRNLNYHQLYFFCANLAASCFRFPPHDSSPSGLRAVFFFLFSGHRISVEGTVEN